MLPIRTRPERTTAKASSRAAIFPSVTEPKRTPGDSLGRAVIAAMSEGVVVSIRATGEVISNAAAERILGLTPLQLRFGEAPPEGWALLEPDGVTPIAEHPARSVLRTGEPIHGRAVAIRRPDGSMTWVLMSAEPYLDLDGPYDGIVMTFADVTEQHRLRERELEDARLRSLDARLNEIEIILDLDGTIVHANDRAVDAYGYAREELIGLPIRELRAEPTLGDIKAQMQVADAGGVRFQTLHKRADGTIFPVEVSSRGFTVGGNRYLHSLVRDLTAAEQAEVERRQLESRATEALRDRDLILAGSPVGITKVRDRRLLWVNRRMAELLGYTVAELTGGSSRPMYLSDEDWEDMGEQAYPVLAAGGSFALERPLVRKDGSTFLARMSARSVDPEDPEGDSIWIVEDLSDAREAEVRLAAAEDQLRAMAAAVATSAPGDPGADAPGGIAAAAPARPRPIAGDSPDLRFRRLLEHLPEVALVFEVARDRRGRTTDWILREASAAGRAAFGPGYPFAVGRPATELFGDATMLPLIAATSRIVGAHGAPARTEVPIRDGRFDAEVIPLDANTIALVERGRDDA